MPKRACKFNTDLKNDYPFLKKLCSGSNQDERVSCKHCNGEFSISHGSRSDIKDHLKSNRHKNSLSAAASSSQVSSYFKSTDSNDMNLVLAAKEVTFAYHTANHNLSFNSNSCSSKLISKFFEPKFSLGKTKSEAVIVSVIAPLAEDELREDLDKTNFVTVSMDASNKKEVKLVLVVIRYFQPDSGVQVKLLDFKSVPGETAAILTDHLLSILKKNNLESKVVAFCGDNCNTNFGGVLRRGQNNVYALLKKKLARNIIGIGCGAHIVHNTIQNSVDVFPIEIEALVVKIYKYFHIYTVRVTQLKEFCDFAEIEYKKLLQHGSTRFLSLLPAIERILQMFEGLKAYFSSLELCPVLIKNFFDDQHGEMYMWFVHGQLSMFNKTILSMEKNKSSATDVACALLNLKTILQERRDNNFLPSGAKKILKTLVDNGEAEDSLSKIHQDFRMFYDRCVSYIERWENSFGGAYDYQWVNQTSFEWKDVEKTAEKINAELGKEAVNTDELFDEFVVAKKCWKTLTEQIKTEPKPAAEDMWSKLFRHCNDNAFLVPNVKLVMEYVFCLPGTSAPVERVFSLMNNTWSDDRAQMHEVNVKSLMICKMNIGLSCIDFYEKIKKNTKLLKKVHSNEKYAQQSDTMTVIPTTL